MTTYQRIRKENEELRHQIKILVSEPESASAQLIKMQWKIQMDAEKAFTYGDLSKTPQNFDGLIKQFEFPK